MGLTLDEAKLERYTQAQLFMNRIRKTKDRVKIGDKLTVWAVKAVSDASSGSKAEVHRKAKVIGVYPRFVRVRLRSPRGLYGCEESFMWDDIAKWNRFLWKA